MGKRENWGMGKGLARSVCFGKILGVQRSEGSLLRRVLSRDESK